MSYFLTAHCPPPHVAIAPAKPIAPEAALTLIETYLSRTAEQPHLHPDCRFNDAGPNLEGRPPGGNIALHQLGRIARGLKGERLLPETDLPGSLSAVDEDDAAVPGLREHEEATPFMTPDEHETGLSRNVQLVHESHDSSNNEDDDNDDEPQLVEKTYSQQMREQGEDGLIVGEIGERDVGVRNGGDIPNVKAIASKDRKKAKRRLAELSPSQSTNTLENRSFHKDKKKKEKEATPRRRD